MLLSSSYQDGVEGMLPVRPTANLQLQRRRRRQWLLLLLYLLQPLLVGAEVLACIENMWCSML
jgi:hypothetical protein